MGSGGVVARRAAEDSMRLLKVALVVALVAGAGLVTVWQLGGRAAAPSAYRTERATRGPIESAVLATGTLKPVVKVQVGSEISGKIATLSADFNSAVTAGEVIATIDPATYRARLDQATADLAVAEATVAAKSAALERAKVDQTTAANLAADAAVTVGRTRRLAAAGHTTEKQLQADELALTQAGVAVSRSEAEIRMAAADLAVAEAAVLQKKAAVKSAETDLDRTVIRSPVSGVVVNRQVDIGQTVAASLQAPLLFEIAQDLKDMQLEASVDEADIGRVAPGQPVVFTVDAFPGRRFEGAVEQVRKAAIVVSNVTTYTVVVAAGNPDLRLLPGMTANVRIVEARHEDVVKVPAAALRFRPEPGRGGEAGPAVYVAGPDGAAIRRPVEIGLASDGETEIASGLEPGEAVIVGSDAERPARRPRSPLGF
jgi:HlyD family secretion protein